MENLAKLTQDDINNGALNRMLINAGIPDVQQYVKDFHHETEELIVEEFQHPDSNKVDDNEPIISPSDLQHWIKGFQVRLDDPVPPTTSGPQQQPKPSGPSDLRSWMQHMTPNGVHASTLPESQQQQQSNVPTDLRSWMQRMAPGGIHPPNETSINTAAPSIAATGDSSAVTGNLNTWLNDWSKQLTEQPPPTSLDNWLQRLVPNDLHEPLAKSNTSKNRLNMYLDAAQQVLSKHGYDVSTEVKPVVQPKIGKFGNVKQMYFLWKVLDKNNDRRITVEDVEIMLQEMGLGFVSKYVAKALFEMVDTDHDGALQFRDFIAMMGLLKELVGAMGSAKA
ncbi:unnamed protein product [Adineta ricciae]|uniref:EF-hand domain-containing protein n=1 Tax=Adineta ricciae TaxID=249248 RepID=A0A813VUN4_ADIRI|nr:unnamed protein product [Adineta ricciae]CAF0851210.1 unnamed protein product [Adineta ricciae]